MKHLVVCILLLLPACGSQPDDARLISAEDFSAESYRGKIVLLNFWATWCKPCILEIPDLVKIRESFDPGRVEVIGVSLDRGRDPMTTRFKVLDFIAEHGINYPVVLDNEWKLVRRYYAADSVPRTFILDQEGGIYREHRGLPTDEDGAVDPFGAYSRDIQALMNGN